MKIEIEVEYTKSITDHKVRLFADVYDGAGRKIDVFQASSSWHSEARGPIIVPNMISEAMYTLARQMRTLHYDD